LRTHGVERLDVLAVGGLRDEAVLRELTTGNLALDGQRIVGAAPLEEIALRLTLACRSGIRVAVEGAAWVWPETLDGMQPGDEALVYADVPAGRPLRLSLDGRAVAVGELAGIERPLLERAWIQARIERMVHLRDAALSGDDDLRRALALQITELSVKHRVLSPYTALLVLETEADYARFGLDRRALADILTVGAGGLDVLARTQPPRFPSGRVPVDTQKAELSDEEIEALQAWGNVAESEPAAEAVVGGVEGGVPGGVVGGVPGNDAGMASILPPSAARAAPRAQPVEVPEAVEESDDAPLRVAPREETVEREEKERRISPYSGRFGEVMAHLAAGRVNEARALAEPWSVEAPGDVLALLALGETWEAAGETSAAARAYGSLIDLFPGRVDMRRLAGERLERLGEAGLGLAIDTYRKAVLDRPDHLSGHRLLAWALLRAGRFAEAFNAIDQSLARDYPGGRFAGADRVLREDLGLLAAAWQKAEPARREEIRSRLAARGAHLDTWPSLRFVLSWETDANDVDLHVYDRRGAHAYYSQKTLPSGGELYADVTTGYGPECFTIRDPDNEAAPYNLRVHYYSRGPMGYGMGTVHVIRHDGEGGLTVEPRPFVMMVDDAMVDAGSVGEGKTDRKASR
jgi:tetratricopeptide (TPR) repeat protein